MSTPHGTQRVIVRMIDGQTVEVDRLTPADILDLADQIVSHRREQVIGSAKAAGLSPEQVYKVVNETDVTPLAWADIVDAVILHARWTIRVVEMAVKRAGHDPARLDVAHVVTAALALIGFETTPKAEGESPLEPTGETSP
jgi:hypothetical protein